MYIEAIKKDNFFISVVEPLRYPTLMTFWGLFSR